MRALCDASLSTRKGRPDTPTQCRLVLPLFSGFSDFRREIPTSTRRQAVPAQEATRRCRLPLGKSTSLRVHYFRGIPGIQPATWRPPGGDTGTLFFKVSLSLSLCHIPTAPSPLSIRITCITRSAEARKITARPTTAALSLRSRDACISRDEAVCGQSTEARKLGYTSLGGDPRDVRRLCWVCGEPRRECRLRRGK